ncbi:hypothetical protein [Shimia sp.]|uniref:hypothetical protein n=1 Tax=Shimia sp. TaxID=1954381 RepID=UPI00356B4329
MTKFEFKVVPAPAKGRKARGVKGTDGRFAYALESVMNEMAAEGWEFLRTETLPSEERSGLTSTTMSFRSVMVFRRQRADDVSAFRPRLLEKTAQKVLPRPQPAEVASKAAPDTTEEDEPQTGFIARAEAGEPANLPVALLARARSVTRPRTSEDPDQAAEAAE